MNELLLKVNANYHPSFGISNKRQVQVLCSYHLWEGLDIPQDALTRVIIHDLPFPPKDPLFEARRKHAKDPFREVDLPFMLLRLRQGAGTINSNIGGLGNCPSIIRWRGTSDED